jgi:UDP:flavonoid glycosyltransferase YjiC (YdhE family)
MAPLRRANLVVTHGGMNTILESLREGLPLFVLPVANDQPGIAARVAYMGVGEFTPIQKLTAATMRQAVQRGLTTASYRETAARIAEKHRNLNGRALAADLIESAFTKRRRIRCDLVPGGL